MRVRSKVALWCLAVLVLLILAVAISVAMFWSSLDDDPIDGWLEKPTTPTTTATP